jgi:NodT family efflux transporter outer membrane factor (OMF) lipoprotein
MPTRVPVRRLRTAVALALTLALCACYPVVGRDYRQPHLDTPAAFAGAPRGDGVPLTGWWACFHDDEIISLVGRALARAGDMRLALMRIRESRAALGLSDAALGPTVGAEGAVERQELSQYTYIPFSIPPFTDYRADFDASWELDIWGVVARQREQAADTLAAAGYDAQDAANMVSAEVVRLALELRVLQARMAVARAELASAQLVAAAMTARVNGGLDTTTQELDADQSAARTAQAIPPLHEHADEDLHALAVLLDAEPEALRGELERPAATPGLPPAIAIGVPADLLRRRPDVRAAERRLAAATAAVGTAEADRFPRISLSGSFGLESIQRETLLTRRALTWGIGPSVSWNIIDWGRVRAQIHVADRQVDEAFIGFERSVIRAEQQVADALSAIAADDADLAESERALRDATAADSLARVLVDRGLSDAPALQLRHQACLAAQDDRLQALGARLDHAVALAKALGGGWEQARIDQADANPPRATASASPTSPAAPAAADAARMTP